MTIEWISTDNMAPATELHIVQARKFELWVAPNFMIEQSKQPNRWHRFWQRLLLGFEWRVHHDA